MNEKINVCNSRDDIYLVFTEKGKFSFNFKLFKRFSVNQLTMLQAENQEYKRRQRSICDRFCQNIWINL